MRKHADFPLDRAKLHAHAWRLGYYSVELLFYWSNFW